MGPLDVPSSPLLAAWAAWLLAGLALAAWRRAGAVDERAAAHTAPPVMPPPALRPNRPPAPAPHGDPFGELQALLDVPPPED